uniref:DZF domain-containing protein n=1 Tax=Caenorhabditis tropicalis TaxID=1561998 RepID=A0A1I7U5W9_9PELO
MTSKKSLIEPKKLTPEELSGMIDKGMGTLLSPPEIEKRKASGELASNFQMEEGFGVYLVVHGGQDYLAVTNILCDKCQRANGKVKRCEAHKKKRKGRRGKKEGDVVDDTSDREKLTGLRHVNDDEDEDDKIDGAFTPDAVMTPGIGGAIIVVPVDAKNNERAGPPAKGLNHVKGILVRGAGNIPQFIPNDRLTKAHKLRYDNYIEGELNVINGKEVFVPNNLGAAKMDGKNSQEVAKAAVADKVDQKVVNAIGKEMVVAVQVEVADNGMPVMKVLEGKPKEKETPVGIIVKNDDQVQFVQIAGRELGGGKDAKMMPCTIPENAKVGEVVADIYVNAEGKAVAAKPGEVPPGGQTIGQVVVGQNDQLVFVPKGENKDEYLKKCAKMTPEMKEKLEKAQANVQAAVTGQSSDHIQGQVNRIGETEAAAAAAAAAGQGGNNGPQAFSGSSGEVRSVGFGAQQFGGSQFARPSPAGGGGGGGGGSGGGNGKVYVNGEVRSVAFGAQGAGGSVFAKPSGTGGGYVASGGKGGAGGGYGGGAGGGGGGGAGGGGAGGKAGGGGEVNSVAFGNQYGGSVFVKGGAGGGGGGGGGVKGGKIGNNTGGSSGADVQSVAFGGQKYGGSVFAKK